MHMRTAPTPIIVLLLALITLVSGGCSSYVAPGRAADLSLFGLTEESRDELTDASIREILARRPLASFPVSVAVVRVQCAGYRSATTEGWGHGGYSVVLDRDIEGEDDIERLERLPDLRDIAPVGRLLLPESLQSSLELRRAAAALRAEMLLLYTLDTTFHVDDQAAPLTVVSLGLLPTKNAWVRTTASALLLDTRNGYLYGLAEVTKKRERKTNAWSSKSRVDEERRKNESEAFTGLVDDLESMWGRIVEEAKNAPPPPKRPATRLSPGGRGWYPTDGG